jgi:hypothetical protein
MSDGPPWQNHSRLLTADELDEIRRVVSASHMNKEVVVTDETTRRLLSCAEALLRDVDRIHPEGLRIAYRPAVDYEALDAEFAADSDR